MTITARKDRTVRFTSLTSDQTMPGPVTIGIDPSLTGFGICAWHQDSGHYEAYVYTSGQSGTPRLAAIREFLRTTLSAYPDIVDIAIEGTVRQSPAASVLGELSGVIKVALYDMLHMVPLTVPPMSLKKYCTGTGRTVTKSQILLAVYKKWNAEFTDDNAADAYVLSRIAGQVSGTAYEKDVLLKLTDYRLRA